MQVDWALKHLDFLEYLHLTWTMGPEIISEKVSTTRVICAHIIIRGRGGVMQVSQHLNNTTDVILSTKC